MKVSEKGALSVYGMGRFPVTLYKEQWIKLLSISDELKKSTYGPWVFKIFRILAKGKALRGTVFDIFGYTAERRMERQMILDFEITMGKVLAQLTPNNHAIACQIAALPQTVRGFGHVKERNLKVARETERKLWAMMGGN